MTNHLTIPGSLEWDSSEVERFTIATLRYAGGKEHDVRYVSETHFDAALAREAEVGRLYDSLVNRSNRERDASYKREDALREELEAIKASVDGYDSPEHAAQVADTLGHANADLQQRLTVVEQRSSELESAAREMLRIAAIANQGSNAYNRAIINLHSALKLAEEGEGS